MIFGHKGHVIYCLRCNHDLLSLTRDVHAGEPLMREQVEPIGKQIHHENGEPITCTHCGEAISVRNIRPPGLGIVE